MRAVPRIEDRNATMAEESALPNPPPLSLAYGPLDRLRTAGGLRWSGLGREMRLFARRLEDRVFPRLRSQGRHEVSLDILPGSGVIALELGDPEDPDARHDFPLLARFLADAGVNALLVDTDLEWNQISDVLEKMWLRRKFLRGGRPFSAETAEGRDPLAEALLAGPGWHMSCAEIVYDAEARALRVRNSYCQLLFSRTVQAYKKRVRRFRDHRAFYKAGPRFALVAALATAFPAILYVATDLAPPTLAALCFLLAAVAGVGTYLVFLVIGAEEYDKEHQARELAQRHQSLAAAYDRISRDLRMARAVQRKILPPPGVQPLPGKVRFATSFTPEMEVGGDYFDLKALDADRVAVLMADVSGHGMAAAFVTGIIKTSFEYSGLTHQGAARFLGQLNEVLSRLLPDENFAAVIFAVYDASRGTLTYSNAGHTPAPFVVRAATGEVQERVEPVQLLAGVDPATAYEDGAVRLAPGDKMVLCTDGIVDCISPKGERLGRPRLEQVLRENAGRTASEMRDAIMDAVTRHTGAAAQYDDQTLVVMEALGERQG